MLLLFIARSFILFLKSNCSIASGLLPVLFFGSRSNPHFRFRRILLKYVFEIKKKVFARCLAGEIWQTRGVDDPSPMCWEREREATENLWLSAFYRRGISLLRLCVHIALGATFLFLQRPGEREREGLGNGVRKADRRLVWYLIRF